MGYDCGYGGVVVGYGGCGVEGVVCVLLGGGGVVGGDEGG